MSAKGRGRAEILRYWRTVELFAPMPVERTDPRRRRFRVVADEPLPWDPGHPVAREAVEPGRVRRHVVQLGVFRLDAVGALVERALGADDEAFDQRPGGESAIAAVLVDADGRLLPDSAVLSSCAWAVGRLARGAPGDVARLEGFADAEVELREAFAHQADDGPLDHERLRESLAAAVAAAGVDGVLAAEEVRVRTEDVRADAEDDTGFLNSFYADDLSVVADAVAAGDVGPALTAYLQTDGEAATGRVDVRTDLAAVAAATAPERLPLARWPAASDRSAALGQQLAIGEALAMEAGLLGVNGPPGTGKTTLVRDLIAAIVVERARRLAELDHPRDAFDGEPFRWRSGDYRRVVRRWRPELTGFEIVIASQNNGAVENVTHDIPGADAIAPEWRAAAEAADGLAELAGTLIDREAWGLVAARLGRLSHRTAFAGRALWSGKGGRGPEGVMRWLARLEDEPPPDAGDWDDAVAAFHRALDRADAVRGQRERAAAALRRWPRLEARRRAVAEEVDARTTRAGATEAALAAATRDAEAAEREEARHAARREEHRRSRPGWGERVTSMGRAMRDWRAHDDELAAPLLAVQRAADLARERLARAEVERDDAGRSAAAAWDEAAALDQERAELDDVLRRSRETLGEAFPGTDWHAADARDRRERTAPWTDAVLDRARTETFLAALALHREFLRHVPREMRQSLHGADDVLRGAAPSSLPEDAARAAWQALFFVVPVISTTFSSLPRMFSHLGREALGWLVVDEGGQASPPAAVGGLWRARRCVVLGDPRQLTPIDTLSLAVQRTLAREHGVDPDWAPRGLSVQQLADRATRLGTWLAGDDDPSWIGTPLTVHRRCDRPIFELVNAIAYDGLMVFATDPEAGASFDRRHAGLPPSKWIDVPSAGARGHWVPAQGEQVEHVLTELGRRGVALDDILVVSPFREVADELRALARRRHRGLLAGTVHTVQGREADVVLLVLGGHPEKPGARAWAGRTPNLLNVAVSRARRRVYVIGDHAAWREVRHFDVLADRLPPRDPVARRSVASRP